MKNCLPEEFVKNMKELLGEEKYLLLENSYSEEPVQALRINPLKQKIIQRKKKKAVMITAILRTSLPAKH